MKKTIKNLFSSQTKDVKDLRNFMFAKGYWKVIDKHSNSVQNAIENTIEIGRKSVKTTAIISMAVGSCIGAVVGELFE